jgi:hypothetical protein
MTLDLQLQVTAAIQQVRQREPHNTMCEIERDRRDEVALEGPPICTCDWQHRVDARLAACVEAAMTFSDEVLSAAEDEAVRAGNERTNGLAYDLSDAAEGERRVLREAGLAAFLAAAQGGP